MSWSFTFKPVYSLKKYSDHVPERRSSIAKSLRLDMINSLIFCPVSKADQKAKIVRAIILEPDTKYSTKEVAAACYDYMENKVKEQVNGLRVLENMIVPEDMEIERHKLRKGTWVMVLKILSDSLWRDFQSGAFRIAGENVQEI